MKQANENTNKKVKSKSLIARLCIFIPCALLAIYFVMWIYCSTNTFMINCVEKKYGIELELYDIVRSHGILPYFNKDKILEVYPKGGDSDTDTFYITRKKNSFNILPSSVHDTYFGLYIREEYEEYLSDIVGQYYDDFKLYTDFSLRTVMTDELTADSTLQDMLNCKDKPFVMVKIYIPYGKNTKAENQEKCDEIFERIALDGSNATLSMVFFNKEFNECYLDVDRKYHDFGKVGIDKYYLLNESDNVKGMVK